MAVKCRKVRDFNVDFLNFFFWGHNPQTEPPYWEDYGAPPHTPSPSALRRFAPHWGPSVPSSSVPPNPKLPLHPWIYLRECQILYVSRDQCHAPLLNFYLSILEKLSICIRMPNFNSVALRVSTTLSQLTSMLADETVREPSF